MTRVLPPAAAPCPSCPYRRDVPSGLWDRSEYEKLPQYDGELGEQAVKGATGVFCCHQQDGRACAGWVGCHDMEESLALRLAAADGNIEADDAIAMLDYTTKVPLFASGAEAAAHGLKDIDAPGERAIRLMRRLRRKLYA